MYLSNARLISLLLALAVLTLCLLWLLSQQMNSTVATVLNTEETTQLAARQPEAITPDRVTAIPDLEPAKELGTVLPTTTQTGAVVPAVPTQLEQPAVTKTETKSMSAAAIPEALVLSDKELKALSVKDRKRYQQMLDSLHSLRDQSTQLTTERQKLEQQMNELEQRNLELTKQLEQVRQTTETTAANQARP